MAETSPFAPGSVGDPTANLPGRETFEELRSQWSNFLEQPGARTAMLQAGIALMQPPSFGDTPLSQFGRAIGSAGEAVTRDMELGRKERESESKIDLAESRSEAERARAGEAASRRETAATIAEGRLGIQRDRLEWDKERRTLQDLFNSRVKYQQYYLNPILKQNADAEKEYRQNIAAGLLPKNTPPPIPKPVMTYEEWMPTSGMGGTGPSTTAPPPASVVTPPPRRPTATNSRGEKVEWDGTNWVPVR